MMKMATGEGSPSGRVPEQGPDWFLVATKACGGETPDLGSVLEVWGYIRGIPPPTGCQNGSRLVFGGYRGFWRRNSRSILFPDVFGYMDIYR